jgi:hypothetical protein
MISTSCKSDSLRGLIIHLTSRALASLSQAHSRAAIPASLLKAFSSISQDTHKSAAHKFLRNKKQHASHPGDTRNNNTATTPSHQNAWVKYMSRTTGRPFWYHKYTKETRWSDPSHDVGFLTSHASKNEKDHNAGSHRHVGIAWSEPREEENNEPASSSTQDNVIVCLQDLALGWVQRLSKRKGMVYYQNTSTGQTTWAAPPSATGTHTRDAHTQVHEPQWIAPRTPRAAKPAKFAPSGRIGGNDKVRGKYSNSNAVSGVGNLTSKKEARAGVYSVMTIPNRVPCRPDAEITEGAEDCLTYLAPSHPLHTGVVHR